MRRALTISISSGHSQQSSFFSVLHSRRFRRRALFALVLFVLTSIFLIFHHSHTPLAPQLPVQPDEYPVHHLDDQPATGRRKHIHQHALRPQVQLSPPQELAAVSSFIASLPQNIIPSFVDPMHPIDPELVLDFDTHSPRAMDEVNNMVEDVWSRNPVFLYSKFHSPISREIKAILETFRLNPAPTIVDVDIRDDAAVLQPLLYRLTSAKDLPILLIGGQAVGSISDLRSLHKSGQLQRRIAQAGGVINGAKRKRRKQ